MNQITRIAIALPFLALTAPLHAHDGVMSSHDRVGFDYGIMCYFDCGDPDDPLTFTDATAITNGPNDFGSVNVTPTLDISGIAEIVFRINSALADGASQTFTSVPTRTDPDGTVTIYTHEYLLSDVIPSDIRMQDTDAQQWHGTYQFAAHDEAQTFLDLMFNAVPVADYTGSTRIA